MKTYLAIVALLLSGNSLATPVKKPIPGQHALKQNSSKPPVTFYIYQNESEIAAGTHHASAFNTEFYFNEPDSVYCPNTKVCAPPKLNAATPVFVFYPPANGFISSLGLNSTVGQAVYIHPSGSLRFTALHEQFLFGGEYDGAWTIKKGSNGSPDSLHHPAGLFYACPLNNTPDHGWQIYVGIPTFRLTECLQFTPYIRYTTNGTYAWV